MRTLMNLNNNWLFSLSAAAVPAALPTDWEAVNLPHTWNGIDGQDGGNDYHRGTGYYAKSMPDTSTFVVGRGHTAEEAAAQEFHCS